MDQRVVPNSDRAGSEGVGGTREEEAKLAHATFVWKVVVNTSLIAMWYLFSISITLVRLPSINHLIHTNTNTHSTTNGCSNPPIPTANPTSSSPSHSSQPAYT